MRKTAAYVIWTTAYLTLSAQAEDDGLLPPKVAFRDLERCISEEECCSNYKDEMMIILRTTKKVAEERQIF